MWHGAQWNFILWGLYFGFLLILEKFILQKALKKLPTAASHIYALMLVMIGFVLFNAQSLSGAVTDIAGLFGGGAIPLMTAETLYYLRSYAVVIALAIVGCMPVMKRAIAALDESAKGAKFLRVAEPIALAILLVLCTAYLVDGSFNPFLYFRF
jgi:alginate O-acetyltransferase complex protein AlgI